MSPRRHLLLSLLTGLFIFGSFYLMLRNEQRRAEHRHSAHHYHEEH